MSGGSVGLKLVSYNIHSGIGTDGRFDLHRVEEVLREVDADLIALQEVGDYRGVTPRDDHPEHLAKQLGLHLAFGPNVERGGRRPSLAAGRWTPAPGWP